MQRQTHQIIFCGNTNHPNNPAKFLCLKIDCSMSRFQCPQCFHDEKHPHLDDYEQIEALQEIFERTNFLVQFKSSLNTLYSTYQSRVKTQQSTERQNAAPVQLNINNKDSPAQFNEKKLHILQQIEVLTNLLQDEEKLSQLDQQIAGITDDTSGNNEPACPQSQKQLLTDDKLSFIINLNIAWVLVVDKPSSPLQQEDRAHGIILLPEMLQGAYCLNLAPNQGKNNNFIMADVPNYEQLGWVVRKTFRVLEPVLVKDVFLAGCKHKNLLYHSEFNNSYQAQCRIIEYLSKHKILQEDLEQ